MAGVTSLCHRPHLQQLLRRFEAVWSHEITLMSIYIGCVMLEVHNVLTATVGAIGA